MSRKSKRKLEKSKAYKEKGIIMKIDAPMRSGRGIPDIVAIVVPENKPGCTAPVEIGISFKNHTSSYLPFKNLVPELVAPDGQKLKRKGTNTLGNNKGLITPGLPVGIILKGTLSWHNNSLTLSIPTFWYAQEAPPITPENSWTFDGLLPGIYRLSFVCEISSTNTLSSNLDTSESPKISPANLSTPEVNLQLVKPVESNKAVVEVDGISFETFISKQIFNIPKKEPGTKAGLKLAGVRITNNTPNPVHFSFYSTIIPEIIKPDGQILFRGSFCDWLREAENSDIVLAMPGEDVTFFPWAAIWWQENDQLQFVIEAGDGGYYTFPITELGTYKIQLNYVNNMELVNVYDKETRNRRQIENIWTGMITTPFVEFQLTRT